MTNGFLSENTEDIFSFEGTPSIDKSGDNSGEATPVPISNTEVKLLSADDTWWEAAWESRTLPVFFISLKTYDGIKNCARHEVTAPFLFFVYAGLACFFYSLNYVRVVV